MPTHTSFIAGTKHRGADAYVRALEPETPVALEPEPTNQYDPNAVKVLHEGKHIGYVPRDLSAEIAKRCKDGSFVSAKIGAGRKLLIEYRT